jgi:hypothetical protein
MSVPRVSVILLSHDDWRDTLECLESLSHVTYPHVDVIAVDNASAHPLLERARAIRPGISIIQNDTNLGYAEGNNAGLRHALARGADYVLVLNNDTLVAPDFLDRLVDAAERHPNAAFVGPMVYHHSEPQVIQSAGGLMTRYWRAYHRGQNDCDSGQYSGVDRVTWVTGCAIMGRRRALEAIGLIDPEFFIYSEEVDWCLRAGERGYEVLWVPQARIWHKGARRDYRPSASVVYLSVRNELLLLQKHHAGAAALTVAWLRHLRTLASYTVRPKWRARKRDRNAIAFALRDSALGRGGPPPGPM